MGKTRCCKSGWWVKHIGSTVRVTSGAFKNRGGRLNGVTFTWGEVAFAPHPQKVKIRFHDLEVVDA